jgi:hypothetical protein
MGFRDHLTEQAAAREDRAAAVGAKKDAWRGTRARELRRMLRDTPFAAVRAIWAQPLSTAQCGTTSIAEELVAWVAHVKRGADRELAAAMFSDLVRERLVVQFAEAYAQAECDAAPDDGRVPA